MTPARIAGPISPWTRSLRGVQALIAALTGAGQQRMARRESLARETERELARGERRERFEWEKTRAAKAFEAQETERKAAREERRAERYFREHGEYPAWYTEKYGPAVTEAAVAAPGVAPEIAGTSRAAVAERLARKLAAQEEAAEVAKGVSEAEIARGAEARLSKARMQVAGMKPVQLRKLERATPAPRPAVPGIAAPQVPVEVGFWEGLVRPEIPAEESEAMAQLAEAFFTGTPEERDIARMELGRRQGPGIARWLPQLTGRAGAEQLARQFYAPAIAPARPGRAEEITAAQTAYARRRAAPRAAPTRLAEAFETAPAARRRTPDVAGYEETVRQIERANLGATDEIMAIRMAQKDYGIR